MAARLGDNGARTLENDHAAEALGGGPRAPSPLAWLGRSIRSTRRSGSASSANRWPGRGADPDRLGRSVPRRDAAELAAVTPAQALRHPTWTMGAKITIDSATLANKGLEVIEAHWLYDVDYDAIEVVIHPQSVVHSAVRFVDGSLKAQLGTPDMRLPIQYALTYPDRRPRRPPPPDLIAAGRLDFRAPDETRFPALRIAREAGRLGPRASAALIAADEVAVARFLDGTLDFPGIPRLLEAAVTRFGGGAGRARRRRARSPSTPRSAPPSPTDPLGAPRVTGFVQSIITIVLFILILGVLVVIHELGHFVTARAAKVRVLEFGIGFPPRAKVLRSTGETLYTLNWLPIGGFVKLEGEDGDRRRRSALVLRPAPADQAGDPRRRRRDEPPPGVRDLHRIAWLGDAARRRPDSARSQPDSPAAAAGLAAGRHHRHHQRRHYQFIAGTDADRRPARPRPARPITLGIAARRRRTTATCHVDAPARRRRSTPARARSASRGVRAVRAATSTASTSARPAEAVQIGVEQTVRALGLIVGGLGQPRHLDRRQPDRRAAGRPARSASRPQIGDVFWNSRADLTAVRRRHPVGQPRGGQHPAVPAARRRPDADDRRSSASSGRGSASAPEQLTYMVGFVFLFAFIIWVTGFDIIRSLGG